MMLYDVKYSYVFPCLDTVYEFRHTRFTSTVNSDKAVTDHPDLTTLQWASIQSDDRESREEERRGDVEREGTEKAWRKRERQGKETERKRRKEKNRKKER